MAHSAYNKWVSNKPSHRVAENEQLAVEIEKIHIASPDKGYHCINDEAFSIQAGHFTTNSKKLA